MITITTDEARGQRAAYLLQRRFKKSFIPHIEPWIAHVAFVSGRCRTLVARTRLRELIRGLALL